MLKGMVGEDNPETFINHIKHVFIEKHAKLVGGRGVGTMFKSFMMTRLGPRWGK
jgi:hypothetical protein